MLKAITRAVNRRLTESVLSKARKRGLTPPEACALAIQAECGFPRFRNESISDYAARAAGVSRERFDTYKAIIESGSRPPADFFELDEFMRRMGKRLVRLAEGISPQTGKPEHA